jgi:hypothetical protein
MGVFMDERIYTALLLFSGVIFMGLLWAAVRLISGSPDADMDRFQIWVLGLFALIFLAVAASYLWYNVKFVQHQGRYFFWGLLPVSVAVALGWREVMQPLQGTITGLLTAVLATAIAIAGYFSGGLNKWTLLSMGLIALLLLLQPLLLLGTNKAATRRPLGWLNPWLARPAVARLLFMLRFGAWSLPFVLLFALDLLIPFMLIVPQLRG